MVYLTLTNDEADELYTLLAGADVQDLVTPEHNYVPHIDQGAINAIRNALAKIVSEDLKQSVF